MEQIASSAVRSSVLMMITKGVSQRANESGKKEYDKNIQIINSKTELQKKPGESSKDSKNLDYRDIKAVVIPRENSENCNKLEVKSNEPNLENQKSLEHENIKLKKCNDSVKKRLLYLLNQVRLGIKKKIRI